MRPFHTPDPKLALLPSIGLFKACTPKELNKIASITTEHECAAGFVLCREGQFGDECFVIVDGTAAVTIGGDQVAVLDPGSIVGELGLLEPGSRTATVTAITPMRLLVLSRSDFTTLIYSAPDVVRRILVAVARRLRQAERRDDVTAAT